ncbi:MAG: protein sorting system archaetidylserine synthase [Haloferacaceae archaeon]
MWPRFRFVGRLGPADVVTVANASLGFVAAVLAATAPDLAARLVLLAAIADALDGILARRYGGTPAGPYLDALADVSSFGVTPALLVAHRAAAVWPWSSSPALRALGTALPALFVVAAVVRLGLYTAYDSDEAGTRGVQTTLAATVLAAGVLAGFVTTPILVGLAGLLAVLMLTRIPYPDLHPQDALVMGFVQAAAVVSRGWIGRGFAYALLFLALAYLLLAPRYYWA